MSVNYIALIPAAGVGSRMGLERPKQYEPINGFPMIWHTIQAFLNTPQTTAVHVVIAKEDTCFASLMPELLQDKRVFVHRVGGDTRHASVLNGLYALKTLYADNDWVLVHDAARPGLTSDLIEVLIKALHDDDVGGILALPIADTLKREEAGRSMATVARDLLWQAQTPQMFRLEILLNALALALSKNFHVTDEASALEFLGFKPKLVRGVSYNLKVTYPDDLALMGHILAARQSQ